jgi:hypothetical protein
MLRGCVTFCLFAGCFSLATAQEVIHALTGTVTSVNPTARTIQIDTDDGSEGLFKDLTKSHTSFDFDKSIRAEAVAADAFTEKGTHVIVYYFGDGDVRTAVALQDLGTTPLDRRSGTVVKFDRHGHLLTIKNSSGIDKSFLIVAKTRAETSVGAVEGYKFNPRKGDQVRVTATPATGNETVLFIRAS